MFKLLQKTTGIKQLSTLAKIDLKEINDICYSDKFGFFFISNQCLGLLNNNGKLEYPILGREGVTGSDVGFREYSLLKNPTSIAFRESSEEIFIVEDSGKIVRSINANDKSNRYISSEIQKSINKILLREYSSGETSICLDNNTIAWTNSLFNMILVLNINGLRVIGCEKRGYSISNEDSYCMFNGIRGITINNNSLYVSDYNNHCIRSIGLDHGSEKKIVIGHPLSNTLFPKKLLFMKDSLLFIDNNSIKSYINNKYNTIYESDNIITITNGPQKKIIILENENA